MNRPDLEKAGFTDATDMWLCEDDKNWSYSAALTSPNKLELQSAARTSKGATSEGVIHLEPGLRLECLIWLLQEFNNTGKLPN